jgi:hypothetical protein
MFIDVLPEGEGSATDDMRLNYIRFKELLMRLGMISEFSHQGAVDSQENMLILELWNLFKATPTVLSDEEKSEDVKVKDAKLAIKAILRIHVGLLSIGPVDESAPIGSHDDQGLFTLSPEDVSRIQKRFNLFYLNRL